MMVWWILNEAHVRKPRDVPHLDQWSLRLQDLDDHHHGDADHGGQCQAPAQTDGPVWVLVHLVIGQGLVFHQREDKTALENKHVPLLVHAVKPGNLDGIDASGGRDRSQ